MQGSHLGPANFYFFSRLYPFLLLSFLASLESGRVGTPYRQLNSRGVGVAFGEGVNQQTSLRQVSYGDIDRREMILSSNRVLREIHVLA